jgi:hypothetical protein
VQTIIDLLRQFWRELMSFLGIVGEYILSVFDPSSGPWPKVIVGGSVLLLVLIVISKSSRVR